MSSQENHLGRLLTFSRRKLIAALAGLRVAAQAEPGVKASRAYGGGSIYTRLFGIRPLLCARGHTTLYGGSLMPPEVMRAMVEANDYFVDLQELNQAAGRRIAELMQAEAAMVTAGAFSAMVLGAAACLTGADQEKIDALPHPAWRKRECLLQKAHRENYDRAYRAAGMVIREFATREQLTNAIGPDTAMIAALASTEKAAIKDRGIMQPHEFVELGKKSGVPTLIDAAAEIPPPETLTRFTKMGFDLVAISGGKGLLGPQATGILAGRKDLIQVASLNHSPNTGIGRGMKVGKEEIVGLVAAMELYLSRDRHVVHETWNEKVRFLVGELRGISGLRAEQRVAADGHDHGFLEAVVSWDPKIIPITGKKLTEMLNGGEPRMVYYPEYGDEHSGVLQTRSMKEGEEILAARRLRHVFLVEAKGKA
ncbi:MAG: aminotransferase class V-fold PLP-dependent enzyme [Acidobacteriia bacterium]|nr:aminotransferase class V-fold PLP-dependent enzyme [Terriglobia bacterium]